MLELRRYDPDGEQFKRDAYVFGNEVGERLKNYQKAGRRFGFARSATGRTGDRTVGSFRVAASSSRR